MRIAAHAYLGQMDELRVAAVPVDRVAPETRHSEAHAPVVLSGVRRRLFRNVVAVVDDYRNFRQLQKIFKLDLSGRESSSRARHRGRGLALREDEVAARLVGYDRANLRILHNRAPARAAALRVRYEHALAYSVKNRGDRVGYNLGVVRAGVRRRLTEILLKRRGVARELRVREEVGPDSQTEDSEQKLLVGRGLHLHVHGRASRLSASRLVEKIYREAAAQEDVLKALASVGRRLPRRHRLPRAVKEYKRQLLRVFRYLVEDPRVVAVQRLTFSVPFVRVELAGILFHRSARREYSLLAYHERLRLRCERRAADNRRERERRECVFQKFIHSLILPFFRAFCVSV